MMMARKVVVEKSMNNFDFFIIQKSVQFSSKLHTNSNI